MGIKEEKALIRQEIRARRSALTDTMLLKIGKDIPDLIFSVDDPDLEAKLGSVKTVALYRSTQGELPVDELAKALIKKGIRVCFPKIENGGMNFYYFPSLEGKYFAEGAYGIAEPAEGLEKAEPADIDMNTRMTVDKDIVDNTAVAAAADHRCTGYVDKEVFDNIGRREHIVEINANAPLLFITSDIVQVILLNQIPAHCTISTGINRPGIV